MRRLAGRRRLGSGFGRRGRDGRRLERGLPLLGQLDADVLEAGELADQVALLAGDGLRLVGCPHLGVASGLAGLVGLLGQVGGRGPGVGGLVAGDPGEGRRRAVVVIDLVEGALGVLEAAGAIDDGADAVGLQDRGQGGQRRRHLVRRRHRVGVGVAHLDQVGSGESEAALGGPGGLAGLAVVPSGPVEGLLGVGGPDGRPPQRVVGDGQLGLHAGDLGGLVGGGVLGRADVGPAGDGVRGGVSVVGGGDPGGAGGQRQRDRGGDGGDSEPAHVGVLLSSAPARFPTRRLASPDGPTDVPRATSPSPEALAAR